MKQLPIRLRLTMWYSVMFAVAALLLTLTSWWMLRRTIDATVRHDLQERLDDVQMELQRSSPDAAPADLTAALDAVYRYRDDGKWLQIRGQDGTWIYRSRRMSQQNVVLVDEATLPSNGLQSEFKTSGHTVRALTARVLANGDTYSIETGVSMAKSETLLRAFGVGLLCMTPAVLLMAAVAGHFLSRKALQPVAGIAYEARRITDRNLDRRLPVLTTNDEVSHLSDTLNHMLARIDASFRSVREFTANASHELRTPLTRMRMEAEIALLRPRPVDEYHQSLTKIHEDTVEMSALIDNLLTLARAEAGSEVLRMGPVDLQRICAEVTNEWSSIARRLSIDLTAPALMYDTAGNRCMVVGEQVALTRLLRIWLDNACKFTPPGGSVRVRIHAEDEVAVLSVEDTGVGIAAEEHGHIFQRFYRVNGNHARPTSGAGLGLSLAAWIAEQHRTSISVRSAPGQGTSMQIALRLTAADPDVVIANTTDSSPAAREDIDELNRVRELLPFVDV